MRSNSLDQITGSRYRNEQYVYIAGVANFIFFSAAVAMSSNSFAKCSLLVPLQQCQQQARHANKIPFPLTAMDPTNSHVVSVNGTMVKVDVLLKSSHGVEVRFSKEVLKRTDKVELGSSVSSDIATICLRTAAL